MVIVLSKHYEWEFPLSIQDIQDTTVAWYQAQAACVGALSCEFHTDDQLLFVLILSETEMWFLTCVDQVWQDEWHLDFYLCGFPYR